MATPPVDEQSRPTQDQRDEFILAVSLCAELEALCGSSGTFCAMAFVGLARCEITQYGDRFSDHLVAVTVSSVNDGLNDLRDLLTALLHSSDDLAHALRLHQARQFIEDAQSLAV